MFSGTIDGLPDRYMLMYGLRPGAGAATMNEVQTPDVRGSVHDDAESIFLMDHPDSTEEIPTLDIGPYLRGEAGGREAAAARLREISMTVGFFCLKGHGVPRSLLVRMFTEQGASTPFPRPRKGRSRISRFAASSPAMRRRRRTTTTAPTSTSFAAPSRTLWSSSRSIARVAPADPA